MRLCLPLEASQGNEHDRRGFDDATHSTQLNDVRTNWLNASPVKRTRYHSISFFSFVTRFPYVSFARCVCFRTCACVCVLCVGVSARHCIRCSKWHSIRSRGVCVSNWTRLICDTNTKALSAKRDRHKRQTNKSHELALAFGGAYALIARKRTRRTTL